MHLLQSADRDAFEAAVGQRLLSKGCEAGMSLSLSIVIWRFCFLGLHPSGATLVGLAMLFQCKVRP